jgi:hypothetical protein
MTTEEIKEKYGIEMIGKEMWVWDGNHKDAKLDFVVFKIFRYGHPFRTANDEVFINASETNPNYKEPKVGDIGYFWDDEESYLCSVLKNIVHDGRPPYYCSLGFWFTNFSHEKQPWMK